MTSRHKVSIISIVYAIRRGLLQRPESLQRCYILPLNVEVIHERRHFGEERSQTWRVLVHYKVRQN